MMEEFNDAADGGKRENLLEQADDEIITKKRIKISSSTKKKADRQGPDVLQRTEAHAVADRNVDCKPLKRFKYVLSQKSENDAQNSSKIALQAFILDNGISILVAPASFCKERLQGNNFEIKLVPYSATMSGKQKRGAQRIHAGSILCTITIECAGDDGTISSSSYDLISPIGGKLLEVNEGLLDNKHLLSHENYGTGYIAILFPEEEIPSIDGCRDFDALSQKISNQQQSKLSRVCYAWQKGECTRGDTCKFNHVSPC